MTTPHRLEQESPGLAPRSSRSPKLLLGLLCILAGVLMEAWFAVRPLIVLYGLGDLSLGQVKRSDLVISMIIRAVGMNAFVLVSLLLSFVPLACLGWLRRRGGRAYWERHSVILVTGLIAFSLMWADTKIVRREVATIKERFAELDRALNGQETSTPLGSWFTKVQVDHRAVVQNYEDRVASLHPEALLAPETLADPKLIQLAISRVVSLQAETGRFEKELAAHASRRSYDLNRLEESKEVVNGSLRGYASWIRAERQQYAELMKARKAIYLAQESTLRWLAEAAQRGEYEVQSKRIVFKQASDQQEFDTRISRLPALVEQEAKVRAEIEQLQAEFQSALKRVQNL